MPSSNRQRIAELIWSGSTDRRVLAAAWLLIAAECVFAIYHLRPWAIGDSGHYLLLGQNLVQGHYGTVTAAGFEPDPLRPPGYPVILWLLLHVLGLPRIGVVALQLGVYCAALFAIQRTMFPRSGNAIFVLICAVYPFPLFYSTYLLAESWTIALTTIVALLVLVRSWWRYALAGTAAGIAALIRADLLLLPLLLVPLLFIRDQVGGASWLRAGRLAVLPPLAAALVLLPYALWNQMTFGRFSPTPVAGAVGTSLYLSTWQDQLSWDDIDALRANRITPHMEQIGLAPAVREINREIGAPENVLAFDPHAYPTVKLRIAAASAFRHAAMERISEHPGAYAGHLLHNLWALWVTKRYEGLPSAVSIGLAMSSAAVFLLGFAGMALSTLRLKAISLPWILVPITLYPALVHLWLHTEARYTAATRPLLVMFAAGFILWAAKVIAAEPRRPRSRREARTA